MSSVDFSRRSDHDDTPNAMTVALANARARGPVADMTLSNPTAAGLPYSEDAFVMLEGSDSARRTLSYTPDPYGLAETRKAIAHEYEGVGARVRATDIFCVASTSEAYAHLFTTLCDPGDEVITLVPSYPLFAYLARFSSVVLVPSPLAYDGAWHIDFPALRARITPKTKAILVVNPNNPTGSFLARRELDQLLELGIPLIVDEVFASYPLGANAERVSTVAGETRGLCFSLGGLSKLVGLPQAKLAWIAVAGDPALVREAKRRLELVVDTFLNVSSFVMLRATALLDAGRQTRAAIQARTRKNLAEARAVFTGAAHPLHVDGGWYVTLRLPRTKPEETWALELLTKHAIYTHPGSFFDFQEEAYLVLSLLVREEDFSIAARHIAAYVG